MMAGTVHISHETREYSITCGPANRLDVTERPVTVRFTMHRQNGSWGIICEIDALMPHKCIASLG